MTKGWICGFLAFALVLGLFTGVPTTAYATDTEPSTEPTETTAPTEPATEPTEPDPDAPLTSSQELIDMIKTMEGFYPVAYWDYSQWTIGYGTRCPEGKETYYTAENPMTVEEAEILLRQELDYFEAQVNSFDLKHDLDLEQHEFDALVSFSYNCGAGWMRDTNGYFVKAILSGDKSNALIYGMLLWSKANTDYILVPRRKSEANLYINGVYKAYNTTGGVPDFIKHVFLDGNGGTVRYVVHGYNVNEPTGIVTDFSARPTGYTFAGWFTAPSGGKQITVLDGSLSNGTVLYAQWKNEKGEIVQLPKGTVVDPIKVTVTTKVKIRTGPGTYYPVATTLDMGTQLTVTETFRSGDTLWGKCDKGWISLAYTDYDKVMDGTQPETPAGTMGTVTGNVVNIRSGPGTSYSVKYTLRAGDRVSIGKQQTGGGLPWGQLPDGNWICMDYVKLDPAPGTLSAISVLILPNKVEYVQMQDTLDVVGGTLKLTYTDGTTKNITMTTDMISGFSNEKLGEVTLTVRYEGKTTTFQVKIIKATVVFKDHDGTVLSSAQYAYGEAVKAPADPRRPINETHYFEFTGWDKAVTACNGDAVYTARYKATRCREGVVTAKLVNIRSGPGTSYEKVTGYARGTEVKIYAQQKGKDGLPWGQLPDGNWICMDYVDLKPVSATSNGDVNSDGNLNDRDAIYLLRHTLRPDSYPIDGGVDLDFNGDGTVNDRDAIYLLRHTLRPDSYPLYGAQ